MRVGDAMTRVVRTCRPEEDLTCAARIMWEWDCGFVPVVDRAGRVAGVITDRDVCMAAYTKGLPLGSIRVADVMTRSVVSCSREDAFDVAHSLMRRWRVRRLPVLDPGGKLVGVLSLDDIARAAGEPSPLEGSEVASTLSVVGEHRSACSLPPTAAERPVRKSSRVGSLAARQADVEC